MHAQVLKLIAHLRSRTYRSSILVVQMEIVYLFELFYSTILRFIGGLFLPLFLLHVVSTSPTNNPAVSGVIVGKEMSYYSTEESMQ